MPVAALGAPEVILEPRRTLAFSALGRKVWGATARILAELLETLEA